MVERFEKEFYRRGLAWGNFYSCALVFDAKKGTFRVRERRTSKSGDEVSECPPFSFDDGRGTLPQFRAFRSAMRSLQGACSTAAQVSKARVPIRQSGK